MRFAGFGVLGTILLIPASSLGLKLESVEILLGSAYNFETPLKIQQAGQPDIEVDARYETRPLEQPFYYAIRVSFLRRLALWELQLVHHKVYMTNPPEEVQHFEITHGYNIFTVNRVFEARGIPLEIGGGFVLAHTESAVRGRSGGGEGILGTGYEFTGPALVAGVGKRFSISPRVFFTIEGQLVGAWARVSVAGVPRAPLTSRLTG